MQIYDKNNGFQRNPLYSLFACILPYVLNGFFDNPVDSVCLSMVFFANLFVRIQGSVIFPDSEFHFKNIGLGVGKERQRIFKLAVDGFLFGNCFVVIDTCSRWVENSGILNGIIILCVDNIDLRREIVKANRYNPYCDLFLDFRMRLTDAQHYLADAHQPYQVDNLLNTMDFSHEEAHEATPTSACGVELSVVYTVKAQRLVWLIWLTSYKVITTKQWCLWIWQTTMSLQQWLNLERSSRL